MMEAAFSLMQMAKTSAKLTQLTEAKLPYISMLTDPTTGGITASFAMLGDINIAEPGALIAFAGPRVVKETIGKDLPEGFQTSEFVQEHGFLDFIVNRKELKTKLSTLLDMFNNAEINVEYMYAFVRHSGENAVMIFRFDNIDEAVRVLEENKVKVINGSKVYTL